ncbi:triphosphoribosyl-dephospho-CoA synthase MdcB [Sphingomonas sp. PAMC26645]|uniref:triphosphoribosyl-dephospho-CoA synthase n=1 Tax=Sphingomonas sp. PAMC26645 TaxID=2565555 RepID=UPI00109E2969|nr:triphosphoribosyl-dephospho-CoA synthase [Sphingomonas sp. PAMC26645]QCB43313.1 triphosphoribosyl-dephospho-CoA synthase MdcB [Sphingomonas sp. PAMC26645]
MIATLGVVRDDWNDVIGRMATDCLKLELGTYPKPGLVSHVDNGAHADMDAAILVRSADTLAPFFVELAAAGAAGAAMPRLQAIGIAAEREMLAATGGVNTHRGAIFGMGLLAAAAGFRAGYGAPGSLGEIVAQRWGAAIGAMAPAERSNGRLAAQTHGIGGARAEAAAGFPSVYRVALPALDEGGTLAGDAEPARVQACMALIAAVDDTNLFHRGGADGARAARIAATGFIERGGVGQRDWRRQAIAIHRDFVERNLSPGGCADLLAMALFVRMVGP